MTKKQVTKKQDPEQKGKKSSQAGTVAAPSRQAVSGYLLCGKEHAAGKPVPVLTPWNQSVVGAVPLATRAEALIAVAAAEKSFATTRSLPAHERQRILAAVSAGITAKRSEFAATIVAEAGKPLKAALAEVDRAVFTFKVASEEAGREGGEVLPLDLLPGTEGRFGLVRRFPVGTGSGHYTLQFPAESGRSQAGSSNCSRLPCPAEACTPDAFERSGAWEADCRSRLADGGSLGAADGQ